MTQNVTVVVDSTATLDAEEIRRSGVVVVPVDVLVDGELLDGSLPHTSQIVAQALIDGRSVTTSRPAPAKLLEVYRLAAADGARAVVSIHLSSAMSGTYESAVLAAQESPIPVTVVDSRQIVMGLGYAALSAAREAADGGRAADVAEIARQRAGGTSTLFYVDSLEHLRRGGRVSNAGALMGAVLSVKPLLEVSAGRVVLLEKVRTAAKALQRLEDLAVERAEDLAVDVCVQHLGQQVRAVDMAMKLRGRLRSGSTVMVREVSPVIAAHVGPGMLSVVVAPRV